MRRTDLPLRTASAIALIVLAHGNATAAFPGRPILLSAEGGGSGAAWVAYDNGDVLRCTGSNEGCTLMTGLPPFASPVSLSAQPDQATAWIGWSDGSLYRCADDGACTAVRVPTQPIRERRLP